MHSDTCGISTAETYPATGDMIKKHTEKWKRERKIAGWGQFVFPISTYIRRSWQYTSSGLGREGKEQG
jgi:hypothetical protein